MINIRRDSRAAPPQDRYGLPEVSFPTPNRADFLVIEDVPIKDGNFTPLDYGMPHPDNPLALLVWQGPVKGDGHEKNFRTIFATTRNAEDAYAFSLQFALSSSPHPVYLRNYIIPRGEYVPSTQEQYGAPLTSLIGLTLNDGGSGYPATVQVTFSGGGGSGATASATVQRGKIVALTLTNSGTGYTSAPAVHFSPATRGMASATASVQPASAVLVEERMSEIQDPQLAGFFVSVSRVYETLPGYSLVSTKTDSFGGTEIIKETVVAASTVPVNFISEISISRVHVTSVGSGYTSNPTVSFTGGGGTGLAGTAVRTGTTVTGVTITNQGTGYTSSPTVSFTGGSGSGAAAIALLTGTAHNQDMQQTSRVKGRLVETIREVGVEVRETQKVDAGVPGSTALIYSYLVLAISPIRPDTDTEVYERRLFPEDPNLRVETRTVYLLPATVIEYREATFPMPSLHYGAVYYPSFGWLYVRREGFSADVTQRITRTFTLQSEEPEVDSIVPSTWSLAWGFSGNALVTEDAGGITVDPDGTVSVSGRTYTFTASSGDTLTWTLSESTPSLEEYTGTAPFTPSTGWIGRWKKIGGSSRIWHAGIWENTVIEIVMQ